MKNPNTLMPNGRRDHAAGNAVTPYLAAPPDSAAPLRLYCFHHAGGGASVFAGWQDALGPDVAVQPVQLPGRERRVREPRRTDMAGLAGELDRNLDPYLSQPYACYGHSMGALVAWQLVMARRAAGRRLPEVLLVGAANPPHLPPISAATRGMSSDRLRQWLLDMGGMSDMVVKYPEWADAAVSLLKDDLTLCDSHRYSDYAESPPPLPFPLHAFAGRDDAAVGADVIAGWCRYTRAAGQVHTVPGGHLFFRDSPERFLPLLRSLLAEGVRRP
jgi:surfactin synthase thioesterase subunit